MRKINVKINENYISKIKNILSTSSISSLKVYDELLPKYNLDSAGMSFINIFYKETARLEASKTGDELNDNIINKQEEFLYFAYLECSYEDVYPTFEEFKTFSKLLVTAFDDYNPNIIRDEDNHPYVASDGDIEISNIVNAICYSSRHSEHKHAFEFDETKVEIVRNIILDRIKELMREDASKMGMYADYLNELYLPNDYKENIKKMILKNNVDNK